MTRPSSPPLPLKAERVQLRVVLALLAAGEPPSAHAARRARRVLAGWRRRTAERPWRPRFRRPAA